MVMNGVYNTETLENLINTVQSMHNSTTESERLFAGELNTAYTWYINAPNTQEYAVCHKYIQMYKEFITQLHIHTKAIRILAKGYLPILLITPIKLKEILEAVKTTLQKTKPDYDSVIKNYIYIKI